MGIFHRRGLSFRRQRRARRGTVRRVVILVAEAAAALALAFLLVYGLGMRVRVSGDSMETTLSDGESVFVNRLVYRFRDPEPGDVIVFLPNGNVRNPYYIERIVAGPGDTVEIADGALCVNGILFEESDAEVAADVIPDGEELILGGDEYFVVGDNSYEGFGSVKFEYIIGKAWFRYRAINDLGRVK